MRRNATRLKDFAPSRALRCAAFLLVRGEILLTNRGLFYSSAPVMVLLYVLISCGYEATKQNIFASLYSRSLIGKHTLRVQS